MVYRDGCLNILVPMVAVGTLRSRRSHRVIGTHQSSNALLFGGRLAGLGMLFTTVAFAPFDWAEIGSSNTTIKPFMDSGVLQKLADTQGQWSQNGTLFEFRASFDGNQVQGVVREAAIRPEPSSGLPAINRVVFPAPLTLSSGNVYDLVVTFAVGL